MAPIPGESHLSLVSLLSLFFLVHARLSTLNLSDQEALSVVLRDLGLESHIANSNPCSSNGVFCRRRISNNSNTLRVNRIIFNSRQLTGFLSPAIGRLSELKELSLPNNQLTEGIPPQIVHCQKLEILNLQNNHFNGKLPPEISSLAHLRVLDLSSNNFSGEAPFSINSFRKVQVFNISKNSFFDDANPKRNTFLELNSTTDKNSTKAPPKGRHSSPVAAPAPAPKSPQHEHKHKHKHKLKKSSMIIGFAVGAVVGIFSGWIFIFLIKLLLILIRGGGKSLNPDIFSPLIKQAADLAFLENEEALNTLEVIGEGGCGKVYKAPLPGNEVRTLAIKKIVQPPRDAAELTAEDSKLLNKKMRQIRSEIQTVGRIRHRNILPLLAHVSGPDSHYLVYEFMNNGSLQDFLIEVSRGNKELDWLARFKIALGVAAGLEYLHISHTPRIIHRDLKPGNILLDDDMEARIADFGLAKAMTDEKTHLTATHPAGTLGYFAPEYYQTLKFTEKCDIYSYGVILGVLVVGKLPSDEFFQNTAELALVKWMRNMMTSDEPKKAIDPKLMGNGYEEQMLLVLKIACFCTLDDPKQRPNSKEIVYMLSQIQHNHPRDAE